MVRRRAVPVLQIRILGKTAVPVSKCRVGIFDRVRTETRKNKGATDLNRERVGAVARQGRVVSMRYGEATLSQIGPERASLAAQAAAAGDGGFDFGQYGPEPIGAAVAVSVEGCQGQTHVVFTVVDDALFIGWTWVILKQAATAAEKKEGRNPAVAVPQLPPFAQGSPARWSAYEESARCFPLPGSMLGSLGEGFDQVLVNHKTETRY